MVLKSNRPRLKPRKKLPKDLVRPKHLLAVKTKRAMLLPDLRSSG